MLAVSLTILLAIALATLLGTLVFRFFLRDPASGDAEVERGRAGDGGDWSAAPAEDAEHEAALGRLDGVRVLLVDDEPVTAESLQVLFEACGADVRVAGSASQARRLVGSWRPNLLVSELHMPDEDGFGLIASIRRLGAQAGGSVPAVALSTLRDPEVHRRTLAAGFQTSLAKPANPRELLSIARRLCARPERPLTA